MMAPKRAVGAILASLLVLTGCALGSTDDVTVTTSPEPTSEPTSTPLAGGGLDSEAEDPADGPAAQVRGTVTVEGTTYEITDVRNCEPFETDFVDVDLELQGIGERDGERVQIDVYIQTIADAPFDDVSWAGPEGIYGSQDHAGVSLTDGGARVQGSTTLLDSMNLEDPLAIEFDLEVPSEIIACR